MCKQLSSEDMMAQQLVRAVISKYLLNTPKSEKKVLRRGKRMLPEWYGSKQSKEWHMPQNNVAMKIIQMNR